MAKLNQMDKKSKEKRGFPFEEQSKRRGKKSNIIW